jgi:hypothetical protein
MANKEIKLQLTKKVREVLKSPEGKHSFSESSQNATDIVARLREARRVDPDRLNRPITV